MTKINEYKSGLLEILYNLTFKMIYNYHPCHGPQNQYEGQA